MKIEDAIRVLYAQTKVLETQGQKYVVKCYDSSVALKWYFISSMFRPFPYVANPLTRMSREMEFMTYPWKNLKVPKIIDFDIKEKCVIREFIEGKIPEEENDFINLGVVLREIHDNGFVMGDTKFENFLINDSIYVIDAEEAIMSDEPELRAWDILVYFLFVAYKYIQDLKGFENIVHGFLDLYKPSREVALNAMSLRNVQLLSLFPPIHLGILRKIISEF
ncbi:MULTISPECIES: serine/threonine protein kinase [Metallosphaera]|uniref:Mn2+-dependent serine/threonine protein kinase n=3 Tax=Metallosphaera TaxID=41980 RepID=A4YH61_METS5|nr:MULTISPECIES: serine/threonine protein kinase [Metallosphaera]ABP95763.1 Mn2+-dependent serine/threonine protein kinase [Metallosphaera sedula DSM 5348]AIM27747.1 Mn2+-dependent serine/threonine protein kinase [Metallosphaera sedula]AKV74604.1 serine/threonine protein kinase [Metallosphaera sedula]AKV76842.1 serine/threonine protein kinase [Metallosphaera sedula]AKV79093.1 serine/threonine protein kinase [Metallosphaera sedula]